jgi:hypothetical protein
MESLTESGTDGEAFVANSYGNVTFAEDKSLKTLDGMALFLSIFSCASSAGSDDRKNRLLREGSCRRFAFVGAGTVTTIVSLPQEQGLIGLDSPHH